jgi:hypothetical protein
MANVVTNSGVELGHLHDWVVALTKIQIICISKDFGTDVPRMTLNTFAQAKVVATVTSKKLFNFGICIKQQFPSYDPNDPSEVPGDQTNFLELTDVVNPLTLQEAAYAYVKAAVSVGGQVPNMKASLTSQFSQQAWNDFVTSIHTCNLDAILGDPATVITNLNALYGAATQTKLSALVKFLAPSQTPTGGGK